MKFAILASFLFVAAVAALPVEEAKKKTVESQTEDLQPADDLKADASGWGLGGYGGYVSYSKPYYGGYSGYNGGYSGGHSGYNGGYNGGYHGGYNGYSGYRGYSGYGGHSGYGGSYYKPYYGGYNGGYSSGYSSGWAPSYGYKTYNAW